MPYIPTNELVAIHWLKSLDGIPANNVNTTLPDASVWEDVGFITVQLVTGSADLYVHQHQPTLQLDFWATRSNSGKPPWGMANNLAVTVQEAMWHQSNFGRVTTPAEYEDARVQTGNAETEPRRVLTDEARFAVYTMDIQLYWVRTVVTS